jgi:hypothetical protein
MIRPIEQCVVGRSEDAQALGLQHPRRLVERGPRILMLDEADAVSEYCDVEAFVLNGRAEAF